MISIVTATYNSQKTIRRLVESLNNQTNKNFEWVIIDNCSDDSTIEIIKSEACVDYKIITENDFGIYDALNKGIKLSKYDYYLVIGSDDILYKNAIEIFICSLIDKPDAVTAKLYFGEKLMGVRHGSSLLNKQFKYFSSHAVSTIFKKSLHERFGYYSSKFPIAADQFFMLKVANHPDIFIKVIDDVVGQFTLGGVSSIDALGSLTESLRIQLDFENKLLCFAVFFLKLIKNFRKL